MSESDFSYFSNQVIASDIHYRPISTPDIIREEPERYSFTFTQETISQFSQHTDKNSKLFQSTIKSIAPTKTKFEGNLCSATATDMMKRQNMSIDGDNFFNQTLAILKDKTFLLISNF